jgi:signal peptidase I
MKVPISDEKLKDIWQWMICIFCGLVVLVSFRYYIAIPTIISGSSMSPTLNDKDRLIANRTFRITGKTPERYDIITFEAPDFTYDSSNVDESNPVAIYSNENRNIISKFYYNVLDISKLTYIKRVIALPGEHVQIKNGKVYINEEELEESYLEENTVTASRLFKDFVVPEGYVFCLGDNRIKSSDCRSFGCIPFSKIEGFVTF